MRRAAIVQFFVETTVYRGGETLRRDEEQSAEKDDEGARSSGLLAGGYCELPATTAPWSLTILHAKGQ